MIALAMSTPKRVAADMVERFARLGAEPMVMAPGEYDSFLRDEHNTLTEVMRASGAKPQ